MKQDHIFKVMGFVIALAMLLTACAPAATPTAAPEPTNAPEPTAVAFTPQKQEVADCSYGGNLRAIESVDQYTFKFTFCNPEPAFKAKSALAAFDIYDSDYLNEMNGDAAKINENPVGSGPYAVSEWVRGDHITLTPNPNYWGPKVANQTLIFRWSVEPAQRLLELRSGNVDAIDNPGPDDIESIKADNTLAVYLRPTPNLLYFGIMRDTPPWDNEQVRQALAMAIDKQRLVDNFYAPGSFIAEQFVPPTVKPGFTDGLKWYDFNQAEAVKMLKAANFDFDKEYTLYYAERTRAYFPQPTKIATDIQAQLAEIGMKVKLEVQEWGTYLPNTRAGKTPLFLLGWGEDYPDATNWYDVFLTGTSQSFGAPFDDIVAQIRIGATSSDTAVRQKAYDEVNKLVKEHVPVIPLTHSATFVATKAEVENVKIGPYNENFEEMKTPSGQVIFSQNAEPNGLFCADETDGKSFRVCDQIFDSLYQFEYGSAVVKPSLAEDCSANADLTVWTCSLRKDVKFSNGAAFDATDVFATFAMDWDATNPNHVGRVGDFQYTADFFGIINKPAQ